MPGGKSRRLYRSEQRSAQAQRTRMRIVAAADEQFTRSGYTATTMRAIAASAGVSLASVELAFGTKAQLLKTAIDVAIAGDHAPVPVLARDWAAEAQATTSVRDFLTVVARTIRPAMVRSAGLVLAAFDAASTDPTLRSLADQLSDQRSTTVAWIVDGVLARAPLRTGLPRQEAIDQLWLVMDPAIYDRLIRYRNWSPAKYETWFADTVARLLVE